MDNMQENPIDIPEIKLDSDVPQELPKQGKFRFPKFTFRGGKKTKIVAMVLGVILILVVVMGVAIAIPGVVVYGKAKVLQTDANNIKAAISKQNISEVKTATTKLQKDLDGFQSSYNLLGWTRFIPFLGSYWNDGSHAIKGGQYALNAAQIGIDTMTPYADIIGFTGDASKKPTSGEQNANDRISFIASTIKSILPKIDQLAV